MSAVGQGSETWWNRPAGGSEVLTVALPLIVSTAFWSLQLFIDRMFLMWLSPEAMAAALPGGMLYWTMLSIPMGIAAYATTFVAQYHGAGRLDRIGLAVSQSVRFGICVLPLFLLAIPLAPLIFRLPGLFGLGEPDAHLFQLEVTYFRWLAPGAGAVVIANGLSSFYTGRGLTRVVMIVNCSGTFFDIALDYGLIFGKFGLPKMGIAGAAASTCMAEWLNVVVYGVLLFAARDRAKFGLTSGNRFDWPLMKRLLRFGAPSSLPMGIEAFAFTMLTMCITSLGVAEGTATSLAFNVNAVAFIPVFGIGIAVTTLVGQHLGADREDLAARATWSGLIIALIYTASFAGFYAFAPDVFLIAHRAYSDPTQFTPVRDATVVLLRFVAAYCLFDAMQVVFVGALKGAGDTKFILAVATLLSTIGVSVGIFGQTVLGWRLLGWWLVITVWICALGCIYLARFLQGKWRSMRVIEPEAPGVHDDESKVGSEASSFGKQPAAAELR